MVSEHPEFVDEDSQANENPNLTVKSEFGNVESDMPNVSL